MTWRPRFPSLAVVAEGAVGTAARFPWVLGTALLAAAHGVWLVGQEHNEQSFIRVQLALTLGIPLFLAVALYREAPRRPLPFDGRWLDVAALAVVVAHFLAIVDDETQNAYTRFAQLHLAAMLAVAFAGFTRPGGENGFWQFNRARFFSAVLSSLYAGVCFIGLCVALKAVHELFDVEIRGATYGRLWFACAFGLLPWHFLAGMPPALPALERDRTYPAPLRAFGQYLLVPLLVLYAGILYAYGGKILVTRAWPQGLVAWMVSAMAIFGVLVSLLLHPYQRVAGHGWIRAAGRWFWWLILPLLALHLTAMGKRIGQYGMTEHRYIQLILALWLGGLAAAFISGLARNIKVVPISLCGLALLTFVGPWSAYAVSRRSQQHRLDALLARHHLEPGAANPRAARAVTWEEYSSLHDTLIYLRTFHGAADPNVFLARVGLEEPPRQPVKPDGSFAFTIAEASDGFSPTYGYDALWELQWRFDAHFTFRGTDWKIRLERGGRFVLLSRDGRDLARFPVQELAGRLAERYGIGNVDHVPRAAMLLTAEAGGERFRLCLIEVRGKLEDGRPRVHGGRGYLVVKRTGGGSELPPH